MGGVGGAVEGEGVLVITVSATGWYTVQSIGLFPYLVVALL